MLVPTPFILCCHQARPQRPSTDHSEWSCSRHSSCQKSALLLLPGQMLFLPKSLHWVSPQLPPLTSPLLSTAPPFL